MRWAEDPPTDKVSERFDRRPQPIDGLVDYNSNQPVAAGSLIERATRGISRRRLFMRRKLLIRPKREAGECVFVPLSPPPQSYV